MVFLFGNGHTGNHQFVVTCCATDYRSESTVQCRLNWIRNEDTSWPENITNLHIFPSVGFMWLFYQYLYKSNKGSIFLHWIWAPQGSAMLVLSLPVKGRKRLAHDVFDLLSYILPAFFMTSLILSHVLETFKHWFLTNRNRNQMENCCAFIFLFHSYWYW